MKITIPFPLTSNLAYPTNKRTGRRYKSKRYTEWLCVCPSLSIDTFKSKVCIVYNMYFPDERIRDGQNYMKLPLDYLVSQGVLIDDNRKYVCGESWKDCGTDKENPRIEVEIIVQ